MRYGWTGALVLCWVAGPAAGAVKLEWKFKEGDKFYLEEKTSVRETITFMGKTYPQNLDHTRTSQFSVLKKEDDGSFVIEQKILKVHVERGDKKKGSGRVASAKLLQDLQGATFKITLSPKMRVTKFEGYEALMKKMADKEEVGKKEEISKQARALITEDTLTKPIEALFGFLPAKSVSRGDEWTAQSTRPLGVMGALKMTDSYTLKAEKKNDQGDTLATLEAVNIRALYSAPKIESGLAFRLVKGEFKVDRKKTAGTITFNVTQGRMAQGERKTRLSGTATMDAMGTMITMDLDLDETVSSRILDKNPVKKTRK